MRSERKKLKKNKVTITATVQLDTNWNEEKAVKQFMSLDDAVTISDAIRRQFSS